MASRHFYFDFYRCNTTSAQTNDRVITAYDIFQNLHVKNSHGENTAKQVGSQLLELRDIIETDYGYKGMIGKHRSNFLPMIASIGGDERSIILAENENILEKCFFCYFRTLNIIIFQRNRYYLNWNTLSTFLSDGNYTTVLLPILQSNSAALLANNTIQIKKIDLQIARPTNPDLFRDLTYHDLTNSLFASAACSNSAVISLNLRGDARSRDSEQRYLDSSLKRAIREIQSTCEIKKLKLLLEEEDSFIEHPIDMVSERLVYDQSIELENRHPNSIDMWEAIELAKLTKQNELNSYFRD